MTDPLTQTHSALEISGKSYEYFSLPKLGSLLGKDLQRLPYSLRILLEGALRHLGQSGFHPQSVASLVDWQPNSEGERPAIPLMPARILLQDFTGVPVLNDLTGLRAELARRGHDVKRVNPRIPTDLVIDHSLSVESYGCQAARQFNEQQEFSQNLERYQFLKWSEQAFDHLRVLPPGLGICHQINLEHLSQVAYIERAHGRLRVYPDSVLGTDSHTPMINGLGVLGWGVGGIEALAAMLGYASEIPLPDVVGIELVGSLPEGVTPTDLTLNLASRLRQAGVVGKFLEVFGQALDHLPVETRAMVANMSPESGATLTYFPVDSQTLAYLRRTGREDSAIEVVEKYFKAQDLFRTAASPVPEFSHVLRLDLSTLKPTVAGPKRPQDIIRLSNIKKEFNASLLREKGLQGFGLSSDAAGRVFHLLLDGKALEVPQGAALIAAITSCTNTSDPSVMIAAGLLARKAAALGLAPPAWVKTSLAPGSRAVETYLQKAGLLSELDKLGFSIVGFGCATCIGNSGPIDAALGRLAREEGLIGAAVLSGNRNFEGRIHADVRAAFLASPPLVVAFALAGRVGIDFAVDPLGVSPEGYPVYLRDIYPTNADIRQVMESVLGAEIYRGNHQNLRSGSPHWNEIEVPQDEIYPWSGDSTLLLEPDFLYQPAAGQTGHDIHAARVLAALGDSVTTDHISPAGRIAPDSPAGKYLQAHGIAPPDFISFGARRGNHQVMARGTFSNARLRNRLVPQIEGGFTRYLPSDEVMTIFDAAQAYRRDNIPLILLAGKAYGSGSSRDWAAKGVYLLGVRAALAESIERIHRTNLIGMGILPLQYQPGETAASLGLSGEEKFTIQGLDQIHEIRPQVNICAEDARGGKTEFLAVALIDTPLELKYYQAGGLARKVLEDFNNLPEEKKRANIL